MSPRLPEPYFDPVFGRCAACGTSRETELAWRDDWHDCDRLLHLQSKWVAAWALSWLGAVEAGW